MSRRWIQSACIVLVFLAAFAAVIVLDADQGKQNVSVQAAGIALSKKVPWSESTMQSLEERPLTDENETVYITPKGTKYHFYADCSSLRSSSQIEGMRCATAIDNGRDLCKLCEERRAGE